MVQGKKALNNSKPMFAEVVIGDSEAKEMRVAANGRPSRSPYLKQVYPNGVTLILPADCVGMQYAALRYLIRKGRWLQHVSKAWMCGNTQE